MSAAAGLTCCSGCPLLSLASRLCCTTRPQAGSSATLARPSSRATVPSSTAGSGEVSAAVMRTVLQGEPAGGTTPLLGLMCRLAQLRCSTAAAQVACLTECCMVRAGSRRDTCSSCTVCIP